MPWGQIFELFPGRTPGAIQLRYYIVSRKENFQAKYVTESAIDNQLLSEITQIVKWTRDRLGGTCPAQSATAWKMDVVPRQLMGHRDFEDPRILIPKSLILKVNSSDLLWYHRPSALNLAPRSSQHFEMSCQRFGLGSPLDGSVNGLLELCKDIVFSRFLSLKFIEENE